ncbi:MAG TPA: hypothetical protein VJP40_07980 [bacterium]|nr:hypothetical protein [bacterium]
MMSYLLRLIGCLWIFLTLPGAVVIFRRLFQQGLAMHWSLGDAFTLALLIGGVGLLLLRSWGRWLVLAGCAGLIWLKAGAALLALNFSEPVIKVLLFYGIFIVLMLLPQSRSAAR